MMTSDGEMISWKGSGIGKFGERGAVGYRGMLYFQTTAPKLVRLNSVGGRSNSKSIPTATFSRKSGSGNKGVKGPNLTTPFRPVKLTLKPLDSRLRTAYTRRNFFRRKGIPY